MTQEEVLENCNCAHASLTKRTLSWAIDFIVQIILTTALFFSMFAIFQITPQYKESQQIITEEVNYYNNKIEETGIAEFLDDENKNRVEFNIISYEVIPRMILTSYEYEKNTNATGKYFPQDQEIKIEKGNGQRYFSALRKDAQPGQEGLDNAAYFFETYIPSHPEEKIVGSDVDSTDYYLSYYDKETSSGVANAFLPKTTDPNFRIIKPEYAYQMYRYVVAPKDEKDNFETGKKYFDAISEFYAVILQDAEDLFLNSEPYKSTHLKAYYEQKYYQERTFIIFAFLSSILGYLLGVFLPQFIFQQGRTIGRLATGLMVVDKTRAPVTILPLLIRNGIGIFSCFISSILVCAFPPFSGNYEFFLIDMFDSFHFNYASLLVIIGLVCLVFNAVGFFTRNHLTLSDLTSHCEVLDYANKNRVDKD